MGVINPFLCKARAATPKVAREAGGGRRGGSEQDGADEAELSGAVTTSKLST